MKEVRQLHKWDPAEGQRVLFKKRRGAGWSRILKCASRHTYPWHVEHVMPISIPTQ